MKKLIFTFLLISAVLFLGSGAEAVRLHELEVTSGYDGGDTWAYNSTCGRPNL